MEERKNRIGLYVVIVVVAFIVFVVAPMSACIGCAVLGTMAQQNQSIQP